VHGGPHVVLAVANPPDLVRPATHNRLHTETLVVLCRKRSRRDPVWVATPAAKWAVARLIAACVAATSALIASQQPSNHQL
jgi:hypothetical protein